MDNGGQLCGRITQTTQNPSEDFLLRLPLAFPILLTRQRFRRLGLDFFKSPMKNGFFKPIFYYKQAERKCQVGRGMAMTYGAIGKPQQR